MHMLPIAKDTGTSYDLVFILMSLKKLGQSFSKVLKPEALRMYAYLYLMPMKASSMQFQRNFLKLHGSAVSSISLGT